MVRRAGKSPPGGASSARPRRPRSAPSSRTDPRNFPTSAAFGSGARHFTDPEALGAALEAMLGADVTVLVKGSRFMRMERVVWRVVEGRPAHAGAGDH